MIRHKNRWKKSADTQKASKMNFIRYIDSHPGLASWASAFAAFAALGLAVYLPLKTNNDSERQAVQSVVTYAKELRSSALAMALHCDSAKLSSWASWEAVIRDVVSVGSGIPIDKLPEAKMPGYMTLRFYGQQTLLEVIMINKDWRSDSTECTKIKPQLEILSNHINSALIVFNDF